MNFREYSYLACIIHAVAALPTKKTANTICKYFPDIGSKQYRKNRALVLKLASNNKSIRTLERYAKQLKNGNTSMERTIGAALIFSIKVHNQSKE